MLRFQVRYGICVRSFGKTWDNCLIFLKNRRIYVFIYKRFVISYDTFGIYRIFVGIS